MPAMRHAASIPRQSSLVTSIMLARTNMAPSVARFVAVKVIERLSAPLRERPPVTIVRIIPVVDVTPEAVRTTKPGTRSEKHPARKPIGAVVTVRSAIIRRIVKVPIGAYRWRSDADRHLRWSRRSPAYRGGHQHGVRERLHYCETRKS